MYDFDKVYDRRHWCENKWNRCTEEEIPVWIADMDFPCPEPVRNVLKERMDYPFFGYNEQALAVKPVIAEHYRKTYGCEMKEEWLVYVPSVMPGINVGCMVAGGTIMYCEPMYGHIRRVPDECGLPKIPVSLKKEDGRYTFDFDAMEKAITPEVTTFLMCNPHNPVGRVYTKEELMGVLSFCRKHNLLLITDEIHCEVVYEGQHIPMFSLCEDAKINTITASSVGKICNVPAIPLGFVVIPDDDLRARYEKQIRGFFPTRGNAIGALAMMKAYDGSCDQWKKELIEYLRANRDYLEERIAKMDGVSVTHAEGTYMAWIDCSELGLENPCQYFREKAKICFNPGTDFGVKEFVRLTFACPRATLTEVLDRMEKAIKELRG